MRKAATFLGILGLTVSLSACGSRNQEGSQNQEESRSQESTMAAEMETREESTVKAAPESGEGNSLVVYFAYAENIGDTSGMSVDAVTSASLGPTSNTEGNLQVMAEVIQERKSADVFHIVVQEPYDPSYDVMHDRAVDEIADGTLPALIGQVENLDDYDVIYLGTPVWSGSLPQPVVSFLTEHDLSGKTIVPFGIHLGSRFGRIPNQLEELCPDAVLEEGFTINAGTANADVREEFGQWLDAAESGQGE